MEHIQIPHSHRKLLSRKDVFQDSVIHYLLIYQVLAAEDIQCNDQHICHHHQQLPFSFMKIFNTRNGTSISSHCGFQEENPKIAKTHSTQKKMPQENISRLSFVFF